MNILITGSAGFIGFHLAKQLLVDSKDKIVGIDNLSNYYSPKLKRDRIKQLQKINKKNLIFHKIDLKNINGLRKIFKKYKFSYVINLAAQAGVRYSVEKPDTYFDSNILGFYNILKCSKEFKVKHLIVASSSSVYGDTSEISKEESNTDNPLQFYAATKKTNEIISHSFSNIYKLPITVVRFFTVYGPWGRPDMSLYKFVDGIINNKKIKLFNKGLHYRDFTYVDDTVKGVISLIKKIPRTKIPFQIYNLANGKSIYLKNFLKEIERQLNKKAKIIYVKKQQGDVFKTQGSILKASKDFNYSPKTNYKQGISNFLSWYFEYNKK